MPRKYCLVHAAQLDLDLIVASIAKMYIFALAGRIPLSPYAACGRKVCGPRPGEECDVSRVASVSFGKDSLALLLLLLEKGIPLDEVIL